MEHKKYIIWTNCDDIEDYMDGARETAEINNMELDEDGLRDLAYEIRNDYLDDERLNLNIDAGADIVCIASLGLWNGRRTGYKRMNTGNIGECLYFNDGDYGEFFVDEDGEFCGIEHHHDGTNYYTFRAIPYGADEDEIEDALYELAFGSGDASRIKALTEPLGRNIAEVYGWQIVA